MGSSSTDTIKVGGYQAIPMAKAEVWIAKYTDAETNRLAKHPFAFPAYDQFRAEQNDPLVLDDADLLAPALLNVAISIRSYYALQRQRDRLQQALNAEALLRPLAELSDDQIGAHIGGLFAILDEVVSVEDDGDEPMENILPGIGGTKLSKVLHRKRPQSVPLHDKWVFSCYVGDAGHPVPRAKRRTWSVYMTLIAREMASDLREQPDQFEVLQSASKASPPLTDLRLLDVIAWNVGRYPRDQFAM